MPNKSKRNRRALSNRAAAQRAVSQNKNIVSSPAAPVSEAAAPATRVQSEKFAATYTPPSRASATVTVTASTFFSEVKWIGITSGLVTVLLIIAYFIFK